MRHDPQRRRVQDRLQQLCRLLQRLLHLNAVGLIVEDADNGDDSPAAVSDWRSRHQQIDLSTVAPPAPNGHLCHDPALKRVLRVTGYLFLVLALAQGRLPANHLLGRPSRDPLRSLIPDDDIALRIGESNRHRGVREHRAYEFVAALKLGGALADQRIQLIPLRLKLQQCPLLSGDIAQPEAEHRHLAIIVQQRHQRPVPPGGAALGIGGVDEGLRVDREGLPGIPHLREEREVLLVGEQLEVVPPDVVIRLAPIGVSVRPVRSHEVEVTVEDRRGVEGACEERVERPRLLRQRALGSLLHRTRLQSVERETEVTSDVLHDLADAGKGGIGEVHDQDTEELTAVADRHRHPMGLGLVPAERAVGAQLNGGMEDRAVQAGRHHKTAVPQPAIPLHRVAGPLHLRAGRTDHTDRVTVLTDEHHPCGRAEAPGDECIARAAEERVRILGTEREPGDLTQGLERGVEALQPDLGLPERGDVGAEDVGCLKSPVLVEEGYRVPGDGRAAPVAQGDGRLDLPGYAGIAALEEAVASGIALGRRDELPERLPQILLAGETQEIAQNVVGEDDTALSVDARDRHHQALRELAHEVTKQYCSPLIPPPGARSSELCSALPGLISV